MYEISLIDSDAQNTAQALIWAGIRFSVTHYDDVSGLITFCSADRRLLNWKKQFFRIFED